MSSAKDPDEDGCSAYVGTELAVFAGAHNWKRYFAARLRKFISGHVLEVGAGNGNTTAVLCDGKVDSWCCLEPDPSLASQIQTKIAFGLLPSICHPSVGKLPSIDETQSFDTILYIDVLEHIEDDAEELEAAARLLSPGGSLVVLAPAWQHLFSPFDGAIGHFRRYNRRSLEALTPPQLLIVSTFYLDSAGLLASIGNKLALKSASPSPGQIMIWDRFLVPLSRVFDPVTGYRLGKSVVVVWSKKI